MNAKRGEVVVEKVDNPLNSVALRSQRLYLHPIKDTDGPDYSATYFDDDAMAYLGGPWTLEKVSADARANHERWTKQRVASWPVDFTNDDGSVELNVALLGFGALRNNGDIGFGWIVAPSHQRRGISS